MRSFTRCLLLISCLLGFSNTATAQDRVLSGKPVQLEWGRAMSLADAVSTKRAIEMAGCPVSLSEHPSGHPKRFTVTVGEQTYKDSNSTKVGSRALDWCLEK